MTITEFLAQGRVPVTDQNDWVEVGDITGTIFVNYDETTYDSGDETFIKEVRGADIVCFAQDDGPLMTRDQLCEIVGINAVDEIEANYAEKRRELI